MKGKNVGFVSTRFAGIDGVSLEASKWSEVLEQNGHNCFWFAGELDRNPEKSFLEPKAHFQHTQNQWINSQIFGTNREKAHHYRIDTCLEIVFENSALQFYQSVSN